MGITFAYTELGKKKVGKRRPIHTDTVSYNYDTSIIHQVISNTISSGIHNWGLNKPVDIDYKDMVKIIAVLKDKFRNELTKMYDYNQYIPISTVTVKTYNTLPISVIAIIDMLEKCMTDWFDDNGKMYKNTNITYCASL